MQKVLLDAVNHWVSAPMDLKKEYGCSGVSEKVHGNP